MNTFGFGSTIFGHVLSGTFISYLFPPRKQEKKSGTKTCFQELKNRADDHLILWLHGDKLRKQKSSTECLDLIGDAGDYCMER